MNDDILEAATRAAYDEMHGAGAWDNPGTLPDEIDFTGWRLAIDAAIRVALRALAESDTP
jgi:hypothetical protein